MLAMPKKFKWSSLGSAGQTFTGCDDEYDIWYGEAPTYEILDPDLTPWQPLEDWNDYVGILEAMKAIEYGLDKVVGQ